MTQTKQKEIAKEAGLLLALINRGHIDLNRVKGLLAEVAALDSTPVKQSKRRERELKLAAMI